MGLLADKLTKKNLSLLEKNQMVQTVIQRVLNVCQPSSIYWFGSSYNGSMTELSDFDFAILFKTDIELKQNKKLLLTKKLFLDIPIDLIFFTEKTFLEKSVIGGICWQIKNEGVKVYDQSSKI